MDEHADILRLVEISRLYYERNLTQAKIAKKMNISRPAVSKLLSEARLRGIVKIEIKSPMMSDETLLRDLSEVYHLKGGLVVPSGSADDRMITRLLVSQASLYFEKMLPQVNRIGLGWGDTMGRLVDELKQHLTHDEEKGNICPVIGSAPNDIRWYQTNELARIFAEKTGFTSFYLHAPAFPGSRKNKKLFEDGWQSQIGNPVGKSEIHKLLTDCFYCGEFIWGSKHYQDAKHPTLISKELFYRVRERIKRKITGKYKKHSFLLQGLIRCGECDRSVIADTKKNHNYYYCTRFNTNCSQKEYVREEELEKQILETLGSLEIKNKRITEWIRKALKESHSDEKEYHNNTITELNRQYALIQKRLDALYDDKLDGKITKEFYERKFKEYTMSQDDVLNATERHKRANIGYFELGLNIFEISQKAKQLYKEKATLEEKRNLLNFVFSNLFLRDKKLNFVYKNAFQIVAGRAKTGNLLRGLDSNQDR